MLLNRTVNANTTVPQLPPVIFGTSGLGNLYEAIPFETKLEIIKQSVLHSHGTPMFDTAGKYGAGLALEVLGKCLKALDVPKEGVIISNKLGWYQTELKTAEPTFEKGIWREMKNDAVQKISYKGILECFEQGNELLGAYDSQMASIHDPDEYLANNIFFVPEKARWQFLQDKAKQPTIGKLIDEAMDAIEKQNSSLKGVLPKIYADPELNKQRLGELIDLIGTIGFNQTGHKAKDLLGRVYEYFLGQFADAEGKKGG